MRPYWYLLILSTVVISCFQKKAEKRDNTYTAPKPEKGPFVLRSPNGDTIPTGVLIPAEGRRIHPDSVAKPEKAPIKGNPKVVPARVNTHPAGIPKVVQIPEKLTVITPGKDGVPLPKSVPAQGRIIPARQPQPVPALSLQYKDNAIYDIQYLTADHGMNSSSVYCMMEDSRGNLWFGTTTAGAVRYDDHSFAHFTEEEGLNHNYVTCMLEDSRGNLWFGTWGNGVSCFNGHNFTHFSTEEGLAGNFISSILEDSRGHLWIGASTGLSQYVVENHQGSFTHFTTDEGLCFNSVNSMLEDKQGNLWFGTPRGVNRYNGRSFIHFTQKEGLSSSAVMSMLEDSRGNLWFGTLRNGVNRFDGRTFAHFTTEEGLSHNLVQAILEDEEGNLWFATFGNGITRYSPGSDKGSFTHFTTTEGLSSNSVYSIMQDSQGNLWFGTQRGGANRYNSRGFVHYTAEEGLSHNVVYSILEESRNNLWFGTFNSGVNYFNGHNFTYLTEEEGLSFNSVYSLLKDSRGNLWFGTSKGANCYDPNDGRGSFTYFNTEEGLTHRHVQSMLEDKQGNLWFGTKGGVSRYAPNGSGGSFTHFTAEEGLGNNYVRSMLEDRRGHLWFGTAGGGVSRYAAEGNRGSFIHFTTEEGLSHNYVWSMLEDSGGYLWFGTTSGLSRFDPNHAHGKFIRFTGQESLKNLAVSSIAEDNRKNIWISTSRGIALLKPHAGVPASDSESGEAGFQFFAFGKQDGLKRSDIEVNSVCIDQNNRIWWGSRDGLIMLDLNRFELPIDPPKIRLDHIDLEQRFVDYRRLADTSYSNSLTFGTVLSLSHSFDSIVPFYNYPASMELPYYLNHLTFHFSGVDWAAPHNIQYSYLMEGLDKDWSIPQPEPRADFRNLPHGAYTLKVKAIGAAQVWSEPFEYAITILPPWWLAWWAYVLYALATAGLLFVVYRFLLNRRLAAAETIRLKELDQVKTKLYTNITHEFRTPLTIISGMADQIRENPQRWLEEGINAIKRNSSQLLNLVNQMLELRKLEAGSLKVNMVQGDIIAYLKYLLESFHSYAENKGVGLYFQSDLPEFIMDYDPERLQQIVANLLSNAIKFTAEGGEVRLTADLFPLIAGHYRATDKKQKTSTFLMLTVKDSGIGIPEGQLPHIFDRFYQVDDSPTRRGDGTGIGLTLTRELVRLLGGEITVQSRQGEGTEFSVLLPIQREAPMAMASVKAFDTRVPAREGEPLQATKEEKGERPLALIIEDNLDVHRYLQACLGGAYRLEQAFDGRAGLEKALELVPDIIVSDVMMPEKDGLELTQTLKTDPRTSHIPVILLTAKADVESRLAGLERGADAYLAKPFGREELLLRMRKLLELRRQLQRYYLSLAGSPTALGVPSEASPGQQAEDVFVQKVRRLVEENLVDYSYTVEQLCRDMAMSRSQLHRKLTALTGYSANRFIRYIRLSRARQLLSDTEEPISNIAYDTGFTDPGYFTRSFRKEFGVTPTEFREKDTK